MSIYDKASLVLIPSGTKTSKVFSQKPVNGDGDFTFSRSTAATRVNADGNIEKETQNLLKQSNNFDTTWITNFVSLSGGQSGYDGSSDAWEMTDTRASGNGTWIYQNITETSVLNFSFYAKAGTQSFLRCLIIGSGGATLWVDLSDGTISNDTDVISATATAVGAGWYRISFSGNVTASAVRIQMAVGAGSSSSTLGATTYIQDAQLEQGLVARDYIETTTTAVEGGITDNVARLDYTDSSCPALLLEPQRTNLLPYSEYVGASEWLKSNTTTQDNVVTSPEGLVNAARIIETAVYGAHQIYDGFSATSGQAYTASFFAKQNGRDIGVGMASGIFGSNSTYFDLTNGVVLSTTSESASIEDYGNGWFRCSVTNTANSSGSPFVYILLSNNENFTYTGDGTSGAYIYGIQVEAGSYATSYIPTYGTSVTRNQDEADAFNAGDLITDNEGVLFVEFDFAKQDVSQTICLNNNSPSNRIGFWTPATADLHIFATTDGTSQFSTDTGFNLVNGQTYKVAVKWSNNIVTAFANGNLIFTSSTIANPINLYVASMNNSTTTFWDSPVKQYMVFPTALTDQEAIDLTTI